MAAHASVPVWVTPEVSAPICTWPQAHLGLLRLQEARPGPANGHVPAHMRDSATPVPTRPQAFRAGSPPDVWSNWALSLNPRDFGILDPDFRWKGGESHRVPGRWGNEQGR